LNNGGGNNENVGVVKMNWYVERRGVEIN